MLKVWTSLAESEARLFLLGELEKLELGLAEVEEFNIGQVNKLRSKTFREKTGEKLSTKLAAVSIEFKLRYERQTICELKQTQREIRREIEDKFEKNSKTQRRIIQYLRIEAAKVKRGKLKIYEARLENLKRKYREDEEDKIRRIPDGLEEFRQLSVFKPDKFDIIEEESYEVGIIGDLDLKDNEKKVLQMHPKFSIMENLIPGGN